MSDYRCGTVRIDPPRRPCVLAPGHRGLCRNGSFTWHSRAKPPARARPVQQPPLASPIVPEEIEVPAVPGVVALVLGGGWSLWDDLEMARALADPWPGPVIVCNNAGYAYRGRIDHWATLHPGSFPKWEKRRRENGGNTDYVRWSFRRNGDKQPHHVDRFVANWIGSSGGMAVAAAFAVGAEKVVLCGVPMEGRHFDNGRDWRDETRFQENWTSAMPRLLGRVRSFSGWTAERLGEPTAEWVHEHRRVA
jgi:hypothetical protein